MLVNNLNVLSNNLKNKSDEISHFLHLGFHLTQVYFTEKLRNNEDIYHCFFLL